MPYQFAIAGCGHISARHAAAISRVAKLTAVCDSDILKARSLAQLYNVPAYPSLDALLADHRPHIVSVCTPSGDHPAHVAQCLSAGSHVLCEKPLAISAQAARPLISLAQANNKKLFVVKQNRYNAPVVFVKKLLDSQKLGSIHSFQVNCFWNRPAAYYQNSWHGTLERDGGILFTQFSHFIDLLYWFLGDIAQASGWRANFCHQGIIEFEDCGAATLVMKNGAAGSIQYTINTHQANMEGSIVLFGDKGTVKIGGNYLNRLDHFAVEGEAAAAIMNEPGLMPSTNDNFNKHEVVYTELVKALSDPGHSFVEAAEALKSIEMIEQIYNGSPMLMKQS